MVLRAPKAPMISFSKKFSRGVAGGWTVRVQGQLIHNAHPGVLAEVNASNGKKTLVQLTKVLARLKGNSFFAFVEVKNA
jgi:hypothetical protein